MYITTENIEEWCFRYIEKDLNEDELFFFEKELQTSAVLQKEYALWAKTKLPVPPLTIKPDLNKSLYRFSTQFLQMIIEFAFVTTVFILFIYTAPSHKKVIDNVDADTILKPVKENNPYTLSKPIPTKEVFIFRNPEMNSKETIISNAEITIVDSISNEQIISNEQDSVSLSDKKITLDSIPSTKDSTIEKREKPKNKISKRQYQNSNRLIPINNDL